MAELLLALRFLIAFLLYAFLGVLLYSLWQELKRDTQKSLPQVPYALLKVETGSDINQKIILRTVTAVGRAEGNDLVLHDPFASAHHTLLLWREGQWWLEDLESHNGTYLNGEKLDQPRALAPGDQIRIGESLLRFETTPPPAEPETSPLDYFTTPPPD